MLSSRSAPAPASVMADDEEIPDIYSMTRLELLNYAKSKGISGVDSTMRKADILSAVEGAVLK